MLDYSGARHLPDGTIQRLVQLQGGSTDIITNMKELHDLMTWHKDGVMVVYACTTWSRQDRKLLPQFEVGWVLGMRPPCRKVYMCCQIKLCDL